MIIKEITDTKIKYVDYKDPDGVLFTIDKVLVKEIRFQTGRKMKMQAPEENRWYFSDDKINHVTFNFLAFGANTLSLGYERATAPGQSFFVEMKLYGAGFRETEFLKNRTGFGMSAEYRFRLGSFFKSPHRYRPSHVLNGVYVAPVLGFSFGSVERKNWFNEGPPYTKLTHNIGFFGLMGGMQLIVQRTFSIDGSLGLLYFGGNDDGVIYGANMFGGNGTMIGYNLRIGLLFGKERLTDKRVKRPNKDIRVGDPGKKSFF